MKKEILNEQTRLILEDCVLEYLVKYNKTKKDMYRKSSNPFPVSTPLLRALMGKNVEGVRWKLIKQKELIVFLEEHGLLEKGRFKIDPVTENYVPNE